MNVFYNLYYDNKNSYYYYKNNKNLNAIIKTINEQLKLTKEVVSLLKASL